MNFRDQLKQRSKDKIKSKFTNDNYNVLLATSSCDQGVIRNGGRRGASHGGQCILSQFKNLIAPKDSLTFHHAEVASKNNDFDQAQLNQIENLKGFYQKGHIPTIHLGGGHDHAYPFIKSILSSFKSKRKVHILNLDAHLDTRQDLLTHSGTPFRQLAAEFKDGIKITQFGIHPYANTEQNLENLNCEMKVYFKDQTNLEVFKKTISENKKDWFVLSLDADGLDAMTMEAVSAVNHDGLSSELVSAMFQFYFKNIPKDQWAVGIYEYNPLLDNLSSKGARYLASLLYKMF